MSLVAKGTHDWDKFISPEDLLSMTENSKTIVCVGNYLVGNLFLEIPGGCQLRQLQGMTYNPITNKWCWIKDTSVNYALHVTKVRELTDVEQPVLHEPTQAN